uniref:Phospholipase A2 n=1 Tax=Caenorhabditis japonica TaxID=281687 RepID=A0A8R1DTG7_CAEJA
MLVWIGIDECCFQHDKCYDEANDNKICPGVEVQYMEDYSWDCKNSTAICSDENTGCKAALCECDKKVVECWKKYPKPEKKPTCDRTR